MLARLQKIQNSNPSDIARSDYVLKDTIETTSDSLKLSQVVLPGRAHDVASMDPK